MYKIDDSPNVLVFKYHESEKIDVKLSNIPFVMESNPTRPFSILIRIQNPDLCHFKSGSTDQKMYGIMPFEVPKNVNVTSTSHISCKLRF